MNRLFTALMSFAAISAGQPLDPAKLLQLPVDSWPTYNGDYSGRRHRPLTQINTSNVKNLTLAWAAHFSAPAVPGGNTQIKSTPLEVNGVLYFAVPDYAFAADARTGRELWRFKWENVGG